MNRRLIELMILPRAASVLFAIFLIVVAASPVAASSPGEKGEPEQSSSAEPTADLVTTRTIRVIVDPESGEIVSLPFRGSEVLSEPLTKALTRTTEGLRLFELSNDGKGVYLDGRFQHALMVRVKPDGTLETVCTSHSHAAEKFLQTQSTGVDAEPRDK